MRIIAEADALQGLAVSTGYVYWVESTGRVMRVALGGEAPTRIAVDERGTSALAVAGGSVYFANANEQTIRAVPISGGAPRTLAKVPWGAPTALAVDERNVYVATAHADGGAIFKVPQRGGVPVKLSPVAVPGGIAIKKEWVIFTDVAEKWLVRVPIGGGPAEKIHDTGTDPGAVAV